MSDVDLRALERRWRETGSEADEGALVVERLRRGLLDLRLVRLAAACDHSPALFAGLPPVADARDLGWCAMLLELRARAEIALRLGEMVLTEARSTELDPRDLDLWCVAPTAGRRFLDGAHDWTNQDQAVEFYALKAVFLRRVHGGPTGVAAIAEEALRSAFDWVGHVQEGSPPDLTLIDLPTVFARATELFATGTVDALSRVTEAVRPHAVAALRDALG